MTRTQFWILTVGVLVVGPFFLTDVILNHIVRNEERKVVVMERIIQEGGEYSARWRQLAVRIYQAGQQDAALKDVLAREHINIGSKSGAGGASPAPQESISPTSGGSIPAPATSPR